MKKILLAILSLFIVALLYLNVRLYDGSDGIKIGRDHYLNTEVVEQLHFLKKAIGENRAAEEMQLVYPEGYVFVHALYALAWCDVIRQLPAMSVTWQEGMEEVQKSLTALASPQAIAPFPKETPLLYGAFYRGWTTYAQGKALQILLDDVRDTALVQAFQQNCRQIAAAYRKNAKPYLESYRGQTWPADNVLCLAALALHDRLFPPAFEVDISTRFTQIQNTLSPNDALIPHAYFSDNDRNEVRGASTALMLCLLPEIDSSFARILYERYRLHFLDSRLGLPGIREYPQGKNGSGDVDSGPIVMGIGGAATITGIRVAGMYGDAPTYYGLLRCTEALLLSFRSGGTKSYLLGQLPVLDAFMAWSQAPSFHRTLPDDGQWRRTFQVISLALLVLSIALMRRLF
jgi:hypothetical protein